jgi:hypothetical protein
MMIVVVLDVLGTAIESEGFEAGPRRAYLDIKDPLQEFGEACRKRA